MKSRRKYLFLAVLSVPLPAFATTYFYSSQSVDLALGAYLPADHLSFSQSTAFASSPVSIPANFHISGSTVTFSGDFDIAVTGLFTGSALFVKNGTASLTLSGNNGNLGSNISVNAGALRAAVSTNSLGGAGTSALNLNPGGTIDLNGVNIVRAINLAGGTLVNDNLSTPVTFTRDLFGSYNFGGAGSLTIAGKLSSSGALNKSGPGDLTVTSANLSNYFGVVNVSAGILRPGVVGALGTASTDLNLNPAGTYDLNGFPLNKHLNFLGGALANNNTASPVILANSDFVSATLNPTFAGAGDIILNKNLNFPSLTLVKTGPGMLAVPTSQSFAAYQINGGTLRLDAASVLGGGAATINAGGSFDVNGLPSGYGAVVLNGGALLNNNTSTPVDINSSNGPTILGSVASIGGAGDMSFIQPFSSTLALRKVGTGTLTLHSTNTSTGGITFAEGTTIITVASPSNRLGLNTAPVHFIDGLLRNTQSILLRHPIFADGSTGGFDTSADVSSTGAFSGTGVLNKTGAGTLTLASSNSVSGPGLAVHQGAVILSLTKRPVFSSLSIDPGATLKLSAAYPFIDYTTTSPIDSIRSYLLTGRNSGDWLGAGLVSASAAADPEHNRAIGYGETAVLPVSRRSVDQVTSVDDSAIYFRFTKYGDATLDGLVNQDDYTLLDLSLARNLTNPHWTDGDFDYDGSITPNDFLLIDRAYAFQNGGALDPATLASREAEFGPGYVDALVASLPEPSAGAMLAAVGLLTRRLRRR